MKFCRVCGIVIGADSLLCPGCEPQQQKARPKPVAVSYESKVVKEQGRLIAAGTSFLLPIAFEVGDRVKVTIERVEKV